MLKGIPMKKLKYITLLTLALTSLAACNNHPKASTNKNEKTVKKTIKQNATQTQTDEQKPLEPEIAKKTETTQAAPDIKTVSNDDSTSKNNLVDTIKTQNRKHYIEYFNSTNETSVNGMKDIEELVNDPSKDFDVTIIVAPGLNGEKTKEKFVEWFNQQEHHNFPVTFTDETTLKNYNITTNNPKPIYIDSNGNLNQSSRGINARATNEAIKSYIKNNVK